jgi:hypothetical protein
MLDPRSRRWVEVSDFAFLSEENYSFRKIFQQGHIKEQGHRNLLQVIDAPVLRIFTPPTC